MKKVDWEAFKIIVPGTILIVMLCLFNISYFFVPKHNYSVEVTNTTFLGLSIPVWNSIWGISSTLLSLLMCFIGIKYSYGIVQKFIWYVPTPYFSISAIYLVCCYLQWVLWDDLVWQIIWSLICVWSVVVGTLFLIFKKD